MWHWRLVWHLAVQGSRSVNHMRCSSAKLLLMQYLYFRRTHAPCVQFSGFRRVGQSREEKACTAWYSAQFHQQTSCPSAIWCGLRRQRPTRLSCVASALPFRLPERSERGWMRGSHTRSQRCSCWWYGCGSVGACCRGYCWLCMRHTGWKPCWYSRINTRKMGTLMSILNFVEEWQNH